MTRKKKDNNWYNEKNEKNKEQNNEICSNIQENINNLKEVCSWL